MDPDEMIGKTFGRLTVVGRATPDTDGRQRFRCLCSCGGSTIARAGNLKSGNTKSCGCLYRQVTKTPRRLRPTGA